MYRPRLFFPFAVVLGIAAILLSTRSTEQDGPKPHRIGRNNTVLFLSTCPPGLSNVVLATTHALAAEYPDIEIHYGSYPKLSKAVEHISRFGSKGPQKVTFHPLKGLPYAESIAAQGLFFHDLLNSPGLFGLSKFLKNLQIFLMPWSVDEYLETYRDVLRLLDEVDPMVVAVEPMFSPGIDAIQAQGRKFAIITPNSLKDNFADQQPWASVLWKYPAALATPDLRGKRKILKANGIKNPSTLMNIGQTRAPWIAQYMPEVEYPLYWIPRQQDSDLAAWLQRAPTVLVNLGSSVLYDEEGANEMAEAVKFVLDKFKVQVLWKFNKREDKHNVLVIDPTSPHYLGPQREWEGNFLGNLSEELQNGRLRIENWISIDPASLLETGNIVLFVHHGGANCFNEALGTGVPHLVLPLWVDLYDNAVKIEYLGVGIWANKKAAPTWKAEELIPAFERVLGDSEEAENVRKKAKEIGEISQSRGPGRVLAARAVASLARSS
ncbi:hypothetical protein B0O99DRAFT_612371 [Bisporella sp. PMI_857]|nr:hypothetical protein B0O99DRAFT_612371 [Bisporella sp. PMI_857]